MRPSTQTVTLESIDTQIGTIVDRAEHVRLQPANVEGISHVMAESLSTTWWETYANAPEHYQFNPLRQADTDAILFTLVTMAQMWLIWEWEEDGGVRPWTATIDDELFVGAAGITASHWRALSEGHDLLDPGYLAEMQMRDVAEVYRDEQSGRTTLQDLPGRVAKFNELGQVLQDKFDGRISVLLDRAGGYLYRDDGQGLIQLLVTHFPTSFGDWPFYKLPNVFVLHLWGLRDSDLPKTDEFMHLTTFRDLEHLKGGADYYRPLFLMRVGLLSLDTAVQAALKDSKLIARDSDTEHEIRAATVKALRILTERIGTFPDDLPAVEVETHAQAFLRCRHCRVGISDEELYCPYKSVCAAYNDNHELMEIGWPLVETTAY